MNKDKNCIRQRGSGRGKKVGPNSFLGKSELVSPGLLEKNGREDCGENGEKGEVPPGKYCRVSF